MTRLFALAGALLAASAMGCFYFPRAPHGPPGHEALAAKVPLVRKPVPRRTFTTPVVLQRPESLVLQPIGAVYDDKLIAVIQAPNVAFDAFDCLTDDLRAAGVPARKDMAASDTRAPLEPALFAEKPARVHVSFERVRFDVRKGEGVADARIVIRVVSPAGVEAYSRAVELRGTLPAGDDIDLSCRLGQVLATRLLEDAAFVAALGGPP